jgi:hypothetical protein
LQFVDSSEVESYLSQLDDLLVPPSSKDGPVLQLALPLGGPTLARATPALDAPASLLQFPSAQGRSALQLAPSHSRPNQYYRRVNKRYANILPMRHLEKVS